MTLDEMMRDVPLRPAPQATAPAERVRLRPAYAAAIGLPEGTTATIVARYDGRVNLTLEGVPGLGYASGVTEEEVEAI